MKTWLDTELRWPFPQVFEDTQDIQLGLLSIVCIIISITCCFILLCYFSSIPTIKKNVLTHLDELLVLNLALVVGVQCSVCLFSLVQTWRNDYLYLFFYTLLYGGVVNALGVGVALSFFRVLIILSVSKGKKFIFWWNQCTFKLNRFCYGEFDN